ncbi:MAG: HAD-IA family hydrolase [Betaproteobacteria bacterium]
MARMRALFARFDRQLDAVTAEQAARLYREHHQDNRRLVAGAIELLEALHGRCRLGIVTNNSVAEQREKLRALNISGYFDTVVISEEVGVTKPDPEIFAIALERIGAQAQDAVFVGDNWTNDIEGALGAGMAAIWLDRDSETPAPTDTTGEKCLERRAGAGGSAAGVITISALAPVASVIVAIKNAFTERTPGAEKHGQLETLAT